MEIEHQQSDSQQEEFKFRENFFSQKKSETWTAETEDTDDDEEFIPNKEESESEEDEIYYMENEAVKEEELGKLKKLKESILKLIIR